MSTALFRARLSDFETGECDPAAFEEDLLVDGLLQRYRTREAVENSVDDGNAAGDRGPSTETLRRRPHLLRANTPGSFTPEREEMP